MDTAAGPRLSLKKRFAFSLITLAITGIAFFAVGEIVVRLLGYTPYLPPHTDIVIEPGGRLFAADESLGYKHLPGQFRITLSGKYVFAVTHGDDTLRIT